MNISVITSTIGRSELRQAIESVKSQTLKAKHIVFVNGPRYHDATRGILQDYPEIDAFYLSEETGDYGAGGSMADVFAAAPFLVRSEWVLFLDDDNFFDSNHIESLFTFVKRNNLKWAYSLRRFVDKTGTPICDDDWRSLGHAPVFMTNSNLIDNSCYFVHRSLATKYAWVWTMLPIVADRCFCAALMQSGTRSGCTGLSTVNYRIGTGTAQEPITQYQESAKQLRARYPEGYPWRTPRLFV